MKTLSTTSCASILAAAAFLSITVTSAHADCSIFFTPGSGATLSGDASCGGPPDFGENLRAGHQGADGSISVTNGAAVTLDAAPSGAAPFFTVGRTPGGTGTATISGPGSSVTVNAGPSGASSATAHFGRETTGVVTISNGGALNLLDPNANPGSATTTGTNLTVGMDGGNGTLSVNDGAIVVDTGSGAFVFIGREGGVGTVNLTNGSTLDLDDRDPGATGGRAEMAIGRDTDGVGGSVGTLNVVDSSVFVSSENQRSRLVVGRDAGANGNLLITGETSFVKIESPSRADLIVSSVSGSTGTATITDQANVEVDSADASLTISSFQAGTTGTLNLTGGAQLTIGGPEAGDDGDVFVGASFVDFSVPVGGTGTLNVTGGGSELTVVDDIFVGAPIDLGGGGTSNGTLTVGDGGTINADRVVIGAGGVLNGNGGVINANLVVDGGTVAPGASPGILTVNGDFEVLNGALQIEIGGDQPGEFDVLNILGDFIATEPFTIDIAFIDDFAPEEGQSFTFLDIEGDDEPLQTLFDNGDVDVVVSGLGNGFEFASNFIGGEFTTTTTAVGAVPLPPGFVLYLGLLALAGGILRRR